MENTSTNSIDADPLVVWAKAQYTIWDRWLGNVASMPVAGETSLWARATGSVDEALSASAQATFSAQAAFARRWAEGVATDPQSSKIAVESAHQMYELITACAEAKAEACTTMVAALRSLEPERLAAPWLSAWRNVIRGEVAAVAARERLPAASDESRAAAPRKELMPPKSELH